MTDSAVSRHHRATITSIAHYVPPLTVDSTALELRFGVEPGWIQSRTGIDERRIAESSATSDLVVPAALECLTRRGISAEEVDCLIVATVTPDYLMPSTAAVVQRKLGATRAWGFDLAAACSGFLYALITASKLVETGAAKRVLLCAADRMSAFVHPEDRNTSILFGDGAAVVLLELAEEPDVGVIDHICTMDGRGEEALVIPAGGSARPATAETVGAREHTVRMNGRAVFQAAVEGMTDLSRQLIDRNGLSLDDVAWLIPHQANARIIKSVARQLGLAEDRVAINVERYGNTTAATIPLVLSEWHELGRLAPGANLILSAFGAGYTAASVYLRWGVVAPAERAGADESSRGDTGEFAASAAAGK